MNSLPGSRSTAAIAGSHKVSVLMACYNADPYVAQALCSVLAQTHSNFELVIVDDGSTDRTAEIVAQYTSEKVVLLRQENRGAAAARNVAFRHSCGEFVVFLDADDLIGSTHLEALLSTCLKHPGCLALSRWDRFQCDPAEAKFPPRPTEGDFDGADWLELDWSNARPMTQSGMLMIPRDLLDRHGLWNEKLSLEDDFEFFARIISRSAGIRFSPGGSLYYRSAIPGSLSRRRSNAAVKSSLDSLFLGTQSLLAVKNTTTTRRICANLFQAFDYRFFPGHAQLRNVARRRAAQLGGADIAPDGPPGFEKLKPWIGWKAARLAQIAAQTAHLNRASRKKAAKA